MDYIRNSVGCLCAMWQAFLLKGICQKFVMYIYTSAPGHIIDCTEIILGVFNDIVVPRLCMK